MQPESRTTGCNQSQHITFIHHLALRACRQLKRQYVASSKSPGILPAGYYQRGSKLLFAPAYFGSLCVFQESSRGLATLFSCSLFILGYLPSQPLSVLHRSLFSFKRKPSNESMVLRDHVQLDDLQRRRLQPGVNNMKTAKGKMLQVRRNQGN